MQKLNIYERLLRDLTENKDKVDVVNGFTIYDIFPKYSKFDSDEFMTKDLLEAFSKKKEVSEIFNDKIHYVAMNTISKILLERAINESRKNQAQIFNTVFGYYELNKPKHGVDYISRLIEDEKDQSFDKYKNLLYKSLAKAYSTYNEIGKRLDAPVLEIFNKIFSYYDGYSLGDLSRSVINKGNRKAVEPGEGKLLRKGDKLDYYKLSELLREKKIFTITFADFEKLFDKMKAENQNLLHYLVSGKIRLENDSLESLADRKKHVEFVRKKLLEDEKRYSEALLKGEKNLEAAKKLNERLEKIDKKEKVLKEIYRELGELTKFVNFEFKDFSEEEKSKIGLSELDKAIKDNSIFNFIENGKLEEKIRPLKPGLFGKTKIEARNVKIFELVKKLEELHKLAKGIEINHSKVSINQMYGDFFKKSKSRMYNQGLNDLGLSEEYGGSGLIETKGLIYDIEFLEKELRQTRAALSLYPEIDNSELVKKAAQRLKNKDGFGSDVSGHKMGDDKQMPKMTDKWKQEKLVKAPNLTEEQLQEVWLKNIGMKR